MKNQDKLQVMWSLSLPLALPVGQKKCGSLLLPQYKIDFSTKYRLKPSFGYCKSNKFLIFIFNKKNLVFNTVPRDFPP
jgi:hypothetical protein